MLFTRLQKLSCIISCICPIPQLARSLNLKSAVSCAQLVSQRDTCIYLLNGLMCVPVPLCGQFLSW